MNITEASIDQQTQRVKIRLTWGPDTLAPILRVVCGVDDCIALELDLTKGQAHHLESRLALLRMKADRGFSG